MFLRDLLSNSQSSKQRMNQHNSQPVPQPINLEQAKQVVGGCSNPKGCLTRDKGGSTVPPRQPAITDFMDRQGGCIMPFNFTQ